MSAEETLKLIAKQWCTLEDIMKLGHLGRNSALNAKKKIKETVPFMNGYYDFSTIGSNGEIMYEEIN